MLHVASTLRRATQHSDHTVLAASHATASHAAASHAAYHVATLAPSLTRHATLFMGVRNGQSRRLDTKAPLFEELPIHLCRSPSKVKE